MYCTWLFGILELGLAMGSDMEASIQVISVIGLGCGRMCYELMLFFFSLLCYALWMGGFAMHAYGVVMTCVQQSKAEV